MPWIQIASIIMFIGVLLGAFGAHMLKSRLSDYSMSVYQTAIFYHFIHGLALFIVAWLATQSQNAKITYAGISFSIGILIFSGSLYLLALTGIKWLGAITPIGGLLFLAGWLLLILAF